MKKISSETVYLFLLTAFCYGVWLVGCTVYGIGALLALCGILLCLGQTNRVVPIVFLFTLAIGGADAEHGVLPYCVGACLLCFGILFYCIKNHVFSYPLFPFDRAVICLALAIAMGGLNVKGRHPLAVAVISVLSFFYLITGRIFTTAATNKEERIRTVLLSVLCASILASLETVTLIIDKVAESADLSTVWSVIGNKEALQKSEAVTANQYANIIARAVPVCLFFATGKKKRSVLWVFPAIVFSFFVAVTTARASMLTLFVVSLPFLFYCIGKSPNRRLFRSVTVTFVVAVFLIVLSSGAANAFTQKIRSVGFSDNGRFDLWKTGVRRFLSHPFFGCGFDEGFVPDSEGGTFIWYHNTVIQTAVSTGIVGLIALFYYLVTQNRLFFSSFHRKSTVCLYAVLATVQLISLLDIHFYTPQTLLQMLIATSSVYPTSDRENAFALSGGSPVLRMPPIRKKDK